MGSAKRTRVRSTTWVSMGMRQKGHRQTKKSSRRITFEVADVGPNLRASGNGITLKTGGQEIRPITGPPRGVVCGEEGNDTFGMVPCLGKPARAESVETLSEQIKDLAIIDLRRHESRSALTMQCRVHGSQRVQALALRPKPNVRQCRLETSPCRDEFADERSCYGRDQPTVPGTCLDKPG